VAQVVLQSAGVVAIVGELEAASMSQHVWMDGKRHLCRLAEPCHEVMEADRRHRSTGKSESQPFLNWDPESRNGTPFKETASGFAGLHISALPTGKRECIISVAASAPGVRDVESKK
jgi:hypothetical protein